MLLNRFPQQYFEACGALGADLEESSQGTLRGALGELLGSSRGVVRLFYGPLGQRLLAFSIPAGCPEWTPAKSFSLMTISINCLRFAAPAEANRRPEARRDTVRTSQGRTSDAEGCIGERQLANVEKEGLNARSFKARGHPEEVF